MEKEIKGQIQLAHGQCLADNLKHFLENNVDGQYTSYWWYIHCQYTGGYVVANYSVDRMILLKYSNFKLFIGWIDMFSSPGLISRYRTGNAKADQVITNMNFLCEVYEMSKKIAQELKRKNMKFTVIMVMRYHGGFSRRGEGWMSFRIKRSSVSCPKSAGEKFKDVLPYAFGPIGWLVKLFEEKSSAKGNTINVVVMGANEPPVRTNLCSSTRSLLPWYTINTSIES